MECGAVTGFFHLFDPLFKLITQAFYGDELLRLRRICLCFFSEMTDMYHDRVVADTAAFPPDLLVEPFFAYDFVRIFHKIGKQEEFASRKADLPAILPDTSALLIQGERACG